MTATTTTKKKTFWKDNRNSFCILRETHILTQTCIFLVHKSLLWRGQPGNFPHPAQGLCCAGTLEVLSYSHPSRGQGWHKPELLESPILWGRTGRWVPKTLYWHMEPSSEQEACLFDVLGNQQEEMHFNQKRRNNLPHSEWLPSQWKRGENSHLEKILTGLPRMAPNLAGWLGGHGSVWEIQSPQTNRLITLSLTMSVPLISQRLYV
jgi:hypothetical protein